MTKVAPMTRATLVLVPALAAAAAACKGAPAPSPGPSNVTVVQSSVSMGDPHIVSDSTNRLSILFSIYEPLVALEDGGTLPAGAGRAVGGRGRCAHLDVHVA